MTSRRQKGNWSDMMTSEFVHEREFDSMGEGLTRRVRFGIEEIQQKRNESKVREKIFLTYYFTANTQNVCMTSIMHWIRG